MKKQRASMQLFINTVLKFNDEQDMCIDVYTGEHDPSCQEHDPRRDEMKETRNAA